MKKSKARPKKRSSPDSRMKRSEYEPLLRDLQIELMKLQQWVQKKGKKLLIVFEGRDAAGKGGTILRLTQHLNPRIARKVALSKPTDAERGQWYFQRYVRHLPTTGEIVVFDRSWYNRAGVERVMGFCTKDEHETFMLSVPFFERMLISADIVLIKYWLDISRKEQSRRFKAREEDPLKHWKLSPMDRSAQKKWGDYSRAKAEMFKRTSMPQAPWTVVRSDDKKRARINCLRHLLSLFDYEGKDKKVACAADPDVVGSAADPRFAE